MKSILVSIGKVFGYDFGNVKPFITLIRSEDADCITMTTRIGPAIHDTMFTEKEFIDFLDAGASLVGGIVWLDREDANSELVGNPPEDL